MKLMICTSLGVGELPMMGLCHDRVGEWQAGKIKALESALDEACDRGVRACIVAGGLFARGFVAQSLLEAVARQIDEHDVPVYYAPFAGEFSDNADRMPGSDGLVMVHPRPDGRTTISLEEGIEVPLLEGTEAERARDLSRPSGALAIMRAGDDVGISLNGGADFVPLDPLGVSSFGGPTRTGCLFVDVSEGSATCEWWGVAVHPLVIKRVVLDGPASSSELEAIVGEHVVGLNHASCLRVELRGRIPLDTYVNTEELERKLGRYFFYVEVADECELDIGVDDLENDVSLLAEFVRLVKGDDSLSETEKTRILRCGWNVLNGKEPVE